MSNEVMFSSEARTLSPQTRQQLACDLERLSASLAAGQSVRLKLGDEPDADIALPANTVELIRTVLTLESDGKGFLLLTEDAEVTLEKAAEMLRISEPTLRQKLNNGDIPSRYANSQLRIAVAD